MASSFTFNGDEEAEEVQIDNILHAISHGRLMREVASMRKFVTQIGSLQNDINSSDMTVECKSEDICYHRAILGARSPFFAAGLAPRWEEATKGKWDLKDADPAAVKDMLHFIYTNGIPEEGIKERAVELLELARQYQLPKLVIACRKAMLKDLTKENAVNTLIQLDQADPLDEAKMKVDKDEVIKFIEKNFMDIVKDKQFKTFVSNYPDLMTEMYLKKGT